MRRIAEKSFRCQGTLVPKYQFEWSNGRKTLHTCTSVNNLEEYRKLVDDWRQGW